MLRSVARNNVVLLLQYAVGGLVPIVLIPHIVREIGVASFGTLAIALAWANYGSIVVQYAFNLTGPRQIAQLAPTQTELSVVQRIAMAKISLLLIVVLPVIGLYIAYSHLSQTNWNWAIFMVLIAMPLGTAIHSGWYLQATGRFVTASTISITGALCSLTIGFTLISPGSTNNLFISALSLVTGALITGFGTMLITTYTLRQPIFTRNLSNAWSELREGWPLFASQFTAALYGAAGPIIVGWLASIDQAGAFTAVERITGAVVSACTLTHTAAYPTLAKLYKTNFQRYLRLLFLVIGIYLTISASISVACYIFWDPVLHFIFGKNANSFGPVFAAGLSWLIVGIFGTALTGYLTVSGQSSKVLPLNLKILMTSFLLGVPGVIHFGAWAWMLALSASQILIIAVAAKEWLPHMKRQQGTQRYTL